VETTDSESVVAAKAKLRELFTLDNLLNLRGALKARGNLIWRNQTGRMTDETLKEMQDQYSKALFTTLIVMSVPSEVREKYMKQLDVNVRLKVLGVEVSHAPNSIWFKNPAVNKSLPVRFMSRHPERFEFDLARAIAFGDNPAGNDEPLTRFEREGMPFVSVSADASEAPTVEAKENHIGGFEFGTAAVIDELSRVLRPGVSSRDLLLEVLPICRRHLASRL